MLHRLCRPLAAAVLAAFALSTSASALAAPPPKHFIALLNASQEVPPNGTTATGLGYFTFTDATKELCYHITYSGFASPESAAHIHGPALPGVDGGIVFGLPAGQVKTGCIAPLANTEKTNLLKNLLYVNIHSDTFPGGEIRGQILRIK